MPYFIQAQTNTYKQAVVYTTTNIIAPEEDDMDNNQDNQRGGMNFRNMMDGETKFITYLKDEKTKISVKSDVVKATIYRDNESKITTSIVEMMGNKNGFFITDAEQEEMQKKRDSMMAERRKKDTTSKIGMHIETAKSSSEISYTNETKKIAGYECKKAYVISSRFPGIKDSAIIWYTNAFKLYNINSTGGFSNLPMMSNMVPMLNGLEKLDGFVLRYEIKMRRNRKLEAEVTKIELNKELNTNEFKIPSDIEIKPMKEMRMMFGGPRGGGEFMRPRD